MNMFLARVNITIDCEENEEKAKKQLEYALNLACHFLESYLTKPSISYEIRELEEI